jgi:molybdopterin-guanine dinucleotide biosynthesis protein B
MKAVFIVGQSGSGKTTLITRLIKEIKKRGYRVAIVKHASHGFEMDRRGKDTWKFRHAGANGIGIEGCGSMALIKDSQMLTSEGWMKYFEDSADILLIEGYKMLPGQKIIVFRNHPEKISSRVTGVIAVICGVRPKLGISTGRNRMHHSRIPMFGFNDTAKIADLILGLPD